MGDFRRTKRPSRRKISSQPRYDHFDTSPYSMTAARDCLPTWILYTKEPVCQWLFPVRDYYEERLNYQSKCAADSETVLSDGISNNDDTGIKSKRSGNDIRLQLNGKFQTARLRSALIVIWYLCISIIVNAVMNGKYGNRIDKYCYPLTLLRLRSRKFSCGGFVLFTRVQLSVS